MKITNTGTSKAKGMGQAHVEFNFSEFEEKLADHINENAEQIARQIAADARAKVNVVTGNLRKGIKAKKSKFEDGGWIVLSSAPHSWIVEHGHGGPKPAPAHAFLRPALNANIDAAKAAFGAK